MTLRLHRASRTDLLADELGDLLARPLADPFAEEVVVVPAKGVERWLTQRLSHRLGTGSRGGDGVCAGVRFLNPRSLVSLLLDRERDDVWDPDRLVWPLLEVIDAALGEPWCAALSAHLGHGLDGEEGLLRRNRRYSVARRLAGLFASYAVQRPRLVTDWREGQDLDGAGNKLDDDLTWQAELWRRLVKRVGGLPPDVRHTETLERLRRGGDGLDLPPRLSLFGHTRLPVTEVELLDALGELRDVHLWLPQVSGSLWDDLAGRAASGPVPREEDRAGELVRHPLLGSLGRDARELQRTLSVVSTGATGGSGAAPPPAGDRADTLLGWLQHDLRANTEPGAARREARFLRDGDRSVQVHACHGAARQVDVLREVLVGLLEDDPTLEPRDILVMCPDIEAYAPLVEAAFGMGPVSTSSTTGHGGHPGHGEQRVRADQRPVGELDPQPVRRVSGDPDPDPVSGLRTSGSEPEAGRDQRRVRLDVRAHHQDVARLEGRVVLEQADQHLAQHVDLARGPVARVHLEAAVGRVVVAAGPLVDGGGVVGAQVGLEQTQQRRPVVGGWRHRVAVREARSIEGAAQLARVAPERRQQRVADQLGRLVVLAGDGSARAAHVAERVPQGRGGLWEVEVYVAALAERSHELDLGGGEPCVPEQGQPRREVETCSPAAQGRDRRRVPDVRRRRVHATQQPPPQLGLPRQVGVEGPAGAVGVPALAPVGDERRSLGGVRREQ